MVAKTYNQELFDAMVRHQIGLLQYSGSLRNKLWKLLDASESDIRKQIENGLRRELGKTRTPARIARIEKVLRALAKTRVRAWKDVNEEWFDSLHELSRAEPDFMAGIFNTTIPVELGLALPAVSRLKAIVETDPFDGFTLREWAESVAANDLARIKKQINIGLTQGEGIAEITRRVFGDLRSNGSNGATAITRNFLALVVRTSVSHVSATARSEFFHANEELIDKILFIATLDSRTTPICRSLDGKTFDLGKEPKLPLHIGERSTEAAVVDGEVIGERPRRDFTERQLLREFAEREGFDAPRTRDGLPRGTKGDYDAFARRRMRELTGTTPATTTYQTWLKSQSATFQDDILGVTKGKLFRKGGLDLPAFVEADGTEMTLKQLAKMHKDAFRAAGLDPSDFL